MQNKNQLTFQDPDNKLYSFVRGAFSMLTRFVYRFRLHNRERLENLNGPCILLCNHQVWVDPALIAVPMKHLQLRFLSKKELLKSKIMQFAAPKMHMIAVGRGETDLAAMRACSKTLKDGNVLLIFPEGTRHQPSLMHEVETGAAVLALRAKVPLIPVYVHGKPGVFSRVDVYVGTPMDNDDLYEEGANMETAAKLAARIQKIYFALRDEAAKAEK